MSSKAMLLGLLIVGGVIALAAVTWKMRAGDPIQPKREGDDFRTPNPARP